MSDKFKFSEEERVKVAGLCSKFKTGSFHASIISGIESIIQDRGNSIQDGWIAVKAITDESGHWHIIPNELLDEFRRDEENEDMTDSGEFDDKYGGYRTGGDLNLEQLYIKQPKK